MAQGDMLTPLLNAAGNGDFVAAEAGAAVQMTKTPWLERKKAVVSVIGVFVGTIKVSSSPDNVTWTDLVIGANGTATTTTVPILAEVTLNKWMRAECTAYTSGTASVRLTINP